MAAPNGGNKQCASAVLELGSSRKFQEFEWVMSQYVLHEAHNPIKVSFLSESAQVSLPTSDNRRISLRRNAARRSTYYRTGLIIMQVVALAVLLLLASTQQHVLATSDGKKQSSTADAVRHYQMVQDAASLFSKNKKDEFAGGFTSNQDDSLLDQSDRRLGSCSDKLDKCRTKLET